MNTFLKLYLVTLTIFTAIDAVWLTVVAKKFYTKQIGFLMKENPNFLAAILFYLLFIVGLVIFVISPSVEKKSLMSAILLGGLFGLITYATYDLTNLATIKDWPILVTIVDLCWGTFLAASVSALSYLVIMKIG